MEKDIKINLRIISKGYAHRQTMAKTAHLQTMAKTVHLQTMAKTAQLQTMPKTSVLFQKDQHKTEGEGMDTRYILSEDAEQCTMHHEAWKAEYHVPSLFFKKARVRETLICLLITPNQVFSISTNVLVVCTSKVSIKFNKYEQELFY